MNDYQGNVGYVLVGAARYLTLIIGGVVVPLESWLTGKVFIMLRPPGLQMAHTQIVAIILLQLLQTTLGYCRQLVLRFR